MAYKIKTTAAVAEIRTPPSVTAQTVGGSFNGLIKSSNPDDLRRLANDLLDAAEELEGYMEGEVNFA